MRSKSTESMQKLVAMRNNPGATRRKEGKLRERKLSRSIKKVRAEMVEIREGQKRIKEGQREVRIVKARSENDAAKDAALTQTLRFVILQISGANGKAGPEQKQAPRTRKKEEDQ
ncbi:hypothetical protein OIU76_003805 [Salix suchowensis]|nr:hypothetical protein OIU76_003805 [Salix suchowensis]